MTLAHVPEIQRGFVHSAFKAGAVIAGASAMHGYARFTAEADANTFTALLTHHVGHVQLRKLDGLIAVDWTRDNRYSNGNVVR